MRFRRPVGDLRDMVSKDVGGRVGGRARGKREEVKDAYEVVEDGVEAGGIVAPPGVCDADDAFAFAR